MLRAAAPGYWWHQKDGPPDDLDKVDSVGKTQRKVEFRVSDSLSGAFSTITTTINVS